MFAEALKQEHKSLRQGFGRWLGQTSISPFWSVRLLLPVCARRGLLVEHLLHVADFTLHLPACFFHRAAIVQVWIPCRLAGFFFHVAFRFPKSALDLILCARFHKNKIARYELVGCNMIEIEGDLRPKKGSKPRAVILTDTTRLIVRLADLSATPLAGNTLQSVFN